MNDIYLSDIQTRGPQPGHLDVSGAAVRYEVTPAMLETMA